MSSQADTGARTLPKYLRVASRLRDQIAEGALLPGEPAPSGAALARATGYSVITCRKAIQALLADGVLVSGPSGGARPRVPSCTPSADEQAAARAARALSAGLAARRRAAGLTQPQLAGMVDVSVTTIGHAETGRLWQSRAFWESADKELGADGELLTLHDAYRAATTTAPPSKQNSPSMAAVREPPSPDEAQPVPESILIVWTDGVITAVPMDRDPLREH